MALSSRISPYLQLFRLNDINNFFLHYTLIIVLISINFTSISIQDIDYKFFALIIFSVVMIFLGTYFFEKSESV